MKQTKTILTEPQEDELREYFAGGIFEAAGVHSTLGDYLYRLQWGLPSNSGGKAGPEEHHERLVSAVERERRMRMRLSFLTRADALVLRVIYSPIPDPIVWELVSHFGSREVAAVAVHQTEIGPPGDSQWRVLHSIVQRAKGQGGHGPSDVAAQDVKRRRATAEKAIDGARRNYLDSIALAKRAIDGARRARLLDTLRVDP